jgi:hypothetical protein
MESTGAAQRDLLTDGGKGETRFLARQETKARARAQNRPAKPGGQNP